MENNPRSAPAVEVSSVSDITSIQQIRILILNEDQHLETTLFRLEKGWILEFQLGPTLFGKDISIQTNHPISENFNFERNKYYEIEWRINGDETSNQGIKDDAGYSAQLKLVKSGSFHYQFTDKRKSKILGSGYFTVNPVLKYGDGDDEKLLLDSIQCQTILPKSLGPFSEWEQRLLVSKESGYNMIHFPPIQELGSSNSSYCLKDHLKLDPRFSDGVITPTFEDLFKLINKLQHEWKVLSISDIVLNHVASESPWLEDHIECTYNMITAPHLIPAAILDGYLFAFGVDIGKGKFLDKGIPSEITSEENIQTLKLFMETELLPVANICEFYTCDPNKLGDEFKDLAATRKPSLEEINVDELKLIYDSFRGRQEAKVDMELALKIFNKYSPNYVKEEDRIMHCVQNFKNQLYKLNTDARDLVNNHLISAVNNCIATVRYERLQSDGPKLREISEKTPLFPRYFTGEFSHQEFVEKEIFENGGNVMAHNGWVMNFGEPKDLAGKDSDVYLRRELIPWQDCVKLRYGDCYEDCPYLWNRMREYVEETARVFHGIRLDNCHSTPFHVAEYLLDCARRIRPDLYIIAELFTNSHEVDNIFINRLGINSLIREAMRAWNCQELGRLILRYGGDTVGSFCFPNVTPLVPSISHALFYDVTHDNESPIEKKSIFDSLATSAIVNMACCATGSTRGFDELVPHHISVVDEERVYSSWSENGVINPGTVNKDTGIIFFKKRINTLHKRLNDEGYTEVYVDQMNENIIAVSRHNPSTHDTVILVAYTAFSYPDDNIEDHPRTKDLKIEGEVTEIILEACLEFNGEGGRFSKPKNFTRDKHYINGLDEYKVRMKENISVNESVMLKTIHSENTFSCYELVSFTPGSVIILKVSPLSDVKPKLEFIIELSNSLLGRQCTPLVDIASKMSLEDLNYVLYRCSEENSEERYGSYVVPNHGSLVYCGLQGFSSLLSDIRFNNDLGHPFCENLRQGDWMLDYIISLFKVEARTSLLGKWFEVVFENLRQIPRFLIPRYFDLIISSVTNLMMSSAAFQMSEFVRNGSTFVRALALGSVQCVGLVKSSQLPSSPLVDYANPQVKDATMSAGLPHFTVGYMRSWGRDTFISLRGLLLLTGRYEVAKCHILGYAACLRHGLIPNLLGNGVSARFNCRDAVWWWLYSIIGYIKFVPNGSEILNCVVSRIFPEDDSSPVASGIVVQPLHYIMQEALLKHFQGIEFRERNAGTLIDEHMTDLGFNNRIGVDFHTGFIYGGNVHNCGTWMDKMGSSSVAGNRGRPATPRDGSAVELIGLSKAVLRDLWDLNRNGYYPYDSVERKTVDGNTMKWTFKEWEEKIAQNFDDHFWIDVFPKETDSPVIHRRGIYKDTCGATQSWADYQLRCNFPIALVVAPEMTDPTRAWLAIQQAEKTLLGPLGMKTLDPADWNYCGDYNNDDNSSNPKVAHGFNYHQGPEWIWPVGFFLRAKLHFAKLRGAEELKKSLSEVRSYLGGFYNHIITSHWRGLPELTNKNGAYCKDGCRVQAWSVACILEVLYDIHQLDVS